MRIEVKKMMFPSMISSLLFLVLGILLLFKSATTLFIISYVIGAILIALGVMALFHFFTNRKGDSFNQLNIIYGVVCVLCGIFFIKEPKTIGSLMPVFLGIGIIISSSLKIQQALVLRNLGSRYWVGSFVTALLCLICGVVLLFNPFSGAVLFTKIIGLFLLIYAIMDIINTFFLKKSHQKGMAVYDEEVSKKRKSRKVAEAQVVKEVKKKSNEEEQ